MADSERRAHLDALSLDREAILLLAPLADDAATAYCLDHLVPGSPPEDTPVVVVTAGGTTGRLPDRAADGRSGVVVAMGDSPRSTSAENDVGSAPPSPPETVATTDDLGSVGRTIDDYVTAWSASGRRPMVCVDSLSGLLGRGSIGSGYRFLYVLLHRVEGAGGSVHVHADPRRYEEEILRTFVTLFDRVVSFQEGGAVL